jgi:hypothetical protein
MVELRRNSIGGDIMPPFCSLARARAAEFLETTAFRSTQNGPANCFEKQKAVDHEGTKVTEKASKSEKV